MVFIDDATRDDLAKSSTILQCILSMLEFECARDHVQLECIGVEKDVALVSADPLKLERMTEVCMQVNKHFKRRDKKPSCYVSKDDRSLIFCEALELKEYEQLN